MGRPQRAPSLRAASSPGAGRSRVTTSSGGKEAEWKLFLPDRAGSQTDGCNLRRRQVDWKGLPKVRGALRVLSVMGRKPAKKAGDLDE